MTAWRKRNGIYQPVYTPELSRRRAGLGGRKFAHGGAKATGAAATTEGGGGGSVTVTSVTEDTVDIGGTITINGTGFTAGQAVTIDGVSVASPTFDSATQITATVPAGVTRAADADVTVAGVTLASAFRVLGALDFPGVPGARHVNGYVQHVWEDWNSYTTIASIATNNRDDGGAPWDTVYDASYLAFNTDTPDPWFGVKWLRQTLQAGDLGVSKGLSTAPDTAWLRNIGTQKGVSVLQIAWRCTNGVMFRGKFLDQTAFQSGTGTWRWTHEGYDPGTDIAYLSLSSGSGAFFDQNKNTSTNGWTYESADYLSGDPFLDTLRFTAGVDGAYTGRLEWWRTNGAGTTVKLMEYLGDSGQADDGAVYLMPSNTTMTLGGETGGPWYPGTAFRLLAPSKNDSGGGWNGGSQVDVGGIAVWTHDFIDL